MTSGGARPFPPHRRRRFFVDSSAYLALLARDDRRHTEARTIAERLADYGYQPVTTNALLFEAHALIMRKLGINAGMRFVQAAYTGATAIVRVRASDEEQARRIIAQYADKDFSYTDALSFTVMERLDLRLAFTFDRHFSQYGFAQLAAETPL